MRILKDTRFYVGCDLGQMQDHTALVILQYDQGDPHFYCRWAERFALGISYPAICDLVISRMRPIAEYLPYLVVDCTGPGLAVVDLMKTKGLHPTAVSITAGYEISEGESSVHIPKQQLVGILSVALQTGKVQISQGLTHSNELRQELLEYQIRFGRAGRERYEARRAAIHDDLAIALMLALWKGKKREERGLIRGLYEALAEQAQQQGGL